MTTLLITSIIISSVLLILFTFIQNSKKEGLESSISNTGTSQLIGVKKTNDLLEQTTWGLIIILFSLSIIGTYRFKKAQTERLSPNLERAQQDLSITEQGTAEEN